MKISKKSWHYNLFTFADRNKYDDTSNVCKYIRGVLAGMFLSIVIVLLSVLVLVLMLDPIVSVLAYWITDISFISFFGLLINDTTTWLVGTFIYFLMFCVVVVTATIEGYKNLKASGTRIVPPTVEEKVTKFSSLIAAYIKGKHDKICINIKLVG